MTPPLSSHPALLRRIGTALFGAVAFIVLVSLAQEVLIHLRGAGIDAERIDRLSLDRERSLGAWFSSLMLAAVALVLFLYPLADRTLPGWSRARWYLLAAVFLFLSLDEATEIHEMGNRLRHVFGTTGALHFAWLLPALVIVPVGLLAYIPFIREFQGRLRFLVILSAALFLGGALGFEMVAGIAITQHGTTMQHLTYQVFAHLEETLEMLGVATFLMTLLMHMRARLGGIALSFDRRIPAGPLARRVRPEAPAVAAE